MVDSFFVYILWSESKGRFYVGSTDDVEKRVIYHASGFVKSTKSGRPWELLYVEQFDSRFGAVLRENEIKRMKSAIAIRALIGW